MAKRSAGGHDGAKVIVGYARVSTEDQGKHGVSLDIQEIAIRNFAEDLQLPVAFVYREVATGAGASSVHDREVLQMALRKCREQDGLLVVWNWSRLSRNADAVDLIHELLPDRDRIFSIEESEGFERAAKRARFAKAQHERDLISQRTKEGMAQKKRDGAVFGNAKIKQVQASGAEGMSRKAEALVLEIAKILRSTPGQSDLTQQEVADLLNTRGLRTGHGGLWTMGRVRTPLNKARAVLLAEEDADNTQIDDDPLFGLF
ncbi:MAG: recombinase family protein [Tabrizicola sp.]|uniref:recombinase family protein n=1 Tax=Tabrizicola sp. TaxID=2005166 RepID=UPI002AB93F8D|nr:recombinase family protein [Tabrizicola sp.]MDZ4088043.1 recombinase family protein [Tabrizicola sp.]